MHFCATPSQITVKWTCWAHWFFTDHSLITFETWKVSIRSYGMHALTVYARWHVKDLISNYHSESGWLACSGTLLRTLTPEAAGLSVFPRTQCLPCTSHWRLISVHQRRQHWISPGNEQCPKHLTVRRSSRAPPPRPEWSGLRRVPQSNSFWVASMAMITLLLRQTPFSTQNSFLRPDQTRKLATPTMRTISPAFGLPVHV